MDRVASVAVGTGIALAGISGTPAQAVTCEQTWNNTATRWEVRYECNRSAFDSHGIRRVKNSNGFYPAVIRGKAGPRQTFRLKVTPPGYHGVWHFTGRIGGKHVVDGNLSIVGIHNKRTWYSVSSAMQINGQLLRCTIAGKPYANGWSKTDPPKSWNNSRTRPACIATTLLMFDLILSPDMRTHEPGPIQAVLAYR